MNKTPESCSPLRSTSGFALVLVLVILVLVVVMITFFLASAARERSAVSLHEGSAKNQSLADTAVSLVIGAINSATKEGANAGEPRSWTSQPGMLRTFNQNGNLSRVYKLYSWDNLVEADSDYDPFAASNLPPANWAARTAHYTDLNAPNAAGIFPILDPRALGSVDGFSFNGSTTAIDEIPMPVKWMYILADGRRVIPTDDGTTTATIPGNTATNPVVGRIAYWTDDETCKVNINTASEGSYWDWPKAATRDEMQFAGNPPVKGEYNRTPGHPAMTSLSPVFNELDPGLRWSNINSYRDRIETLLSLAPRVGSGGSQGGTLPISTLEFNYSPAYGSVSNPDPVAPKTERLYASPNEMLFGQDRDSVSALSASVGTDDFAARRFFLTASSRAPETNLFETPRISLWPITWPWRSSYFARRTTPPPGSVPSPDAVLLRDNPWMTAEEKLISFSSTLNFATAKESRYFFQRQNPDSPTHDWNNIERNRDLMNYLRNLTGRNIPGFGGNFGSKPNFDRDSTLVKTFDFSRSLINQYTTFANPLYSYTGVMFRSASDVSGSSSLYYEPQAFSVVPIQALGETGLGAFPRLKEAAVMFYATQRREPNYIGPTSPAVRTDPRQWENLIRVDGSNTLSQTTEMRAVLLLDFTQTNPSRLAVAPTFWARITGPSFSVDGTVINLPKAGVDSAQLSWHIGHDAFANPWFSWGYRRAANAAATNQPPIPKEFSNNAVDVDRWVFISDPISVNPDSKTFRFDGSEIRVELFGLDSSNLDTSTTDNAFMRFAEYSINFADWDGDLPTPLAPFWNNYDFGSQVPNPNFDDGDGNSSKYRWVGTEIAPVINRNDLDDYSKDSIALALGREPQDIPTYVYQHSRNLAARFQSSLWASSRRNSGNYLDLTTTTLEQGTINPFQNTMPAAHAAATTLITPFDTVFSMAIDPNAPNNGNGDPRVTAGSTQFARVNTIHAGNPRSVISRDPSVAPSAPRQNDQFHSLGSNFFVAATTGYPATQSLVATAMGLRGSGVSISAPGQLGDRNDFSNRVRPFSLTSGPTSSGSIGDWTSMPGSSQDGGILVRPDQEFQAIWDDYSATSFAQTPYFAQFGTYEGVSDNYFSPNRQVPSPVLLGSIPSSKTRGWQTLAFSPNPVAGSSHPGLQGPKDHLFLDLFWMPVCEPYPISDQLSTAGKVNLNYQILPFTNIERSTGLHAAMKSTMITALPTSAAADYKSPFFMRTNHANTRSRYSIDIPETLNLFDSEIFNNGDVFRSASQLTEMWLVPEGVTAANVEAFWSDKLLTSDTAREAPYDHLYSRVTTKSNTYTVHWKVQAVRQTPASADAGVWNEARDRVISELEGSTIIERYLDPNATDIPDYATDLASIVSDPLTNYYRWRTVSNNLFRR